MLKRNNKAGANKAEIYNNADWHNHEKDLPGYCGH